MPRFVISTKEEARDFVRGCAFFGTGGGGDPKYGLSLLLDALEKGKIEVQDPNSISDSSNTICAYGMGSIAPRTKKVLQEIRRLGLKQKVRYKLAEAIREFELYTGTEIDAIVPLEIGGANTPDPVATASIMGKKVVDGDYSGGRAIPEIIQTSAHLTGKRMEPLTSVDEWGNTVIIKHTPNNLVSEKIGKLVSILAYGNLAGNATYLIKGDEMKKIVTLGSLTKAFQAGKIIGEMQRKNAFDPYSLAEKTDGYMLFEGTIVSKSDEDRDGYYWGKNTVRGRGEFKGHKFTYWYKNENHVSWFDNKPYVTSPDLICVVERRTGEPITNPSSKVGDNVAIIGYRSSEFFRTKEALAVIGPTHFGFKIRFKPIEEILE
jgi:DUF917 family protein